VRARVRARVRACVRACVRARVRACVHLHEPAEPLITRGVRHEQRTQLEEVDL
jgi:hypothetical protein